MDLNWFKIASKTKETAVDGTTFATKSMVFDLGGHYDQFMTSL